MTLPGKADRSASDVIHVGPDGDNPPRWGVLLVLFMRVIAALWIFQGLLQWNVILGPDQALDGLTTPVAIAVVFFAVLDLIAAVGLWLATPWGGVLWLFAVAAQGFVTVFMPGFFAGGHVVLAVDVALMAAYFALTWYAAQERDL